MQQPPQMYPMAQSINPQTQTNSLVTTEQIQKYLDENKKLIMAIMENQNLGKLAECAQYQAVLQKNLMYLAAIADAQPPPPTSSSSPAPPQPPLMASQMTTPHPGMQPPSYFMQQHPQASGMSQQAGMFLPRGPLQFGSPLHQLHDPQQHLQLQQQQQQQQLHQQQAMQGHLGMRPMGFINNNGMQPPDSVHGGSSANVGHRGSKQEGGDGQGKEDGK